MQANGEFIVEQAQNLKPGSLCGLYRIERILGSGGMGTVYLATRADELNMKVALKTLWSWHPNMLEMFRRECNILSGLNHPYIAHLIDAGTLPSGQPWLAMEYVEGTTLDTFLENHPDLVLNDRIELFLKICDALSYAHQQMIIHRDLKPGNIMVNAQGQPRLLDFGIASFLDPETGETTLTRMNRPFTPAYASPEQLNNQKLGAASDVYSLAVIFYEMIAGKKPYDVANKSPQEIWKIASQKEIDPPSVHLDKETTATIRNREVQGDLDTIVLKALEKDTSQRYHSVEALSTDLRLFLEGLPIKARPLTTFYRVKKLARRHPWPIAVSLGVLVFMAAFSVYASWQKVLIERERDRVQQEKETAEKVTDFLVTMFEHAHPDMAPGGEVTALEVLESGRRQVTETLDNSPAVQGRLMAAMGRVYRSLGKYELSLALFEEAVTLARRTHNPSRNLELEWVRTLQAAGDFQAAQKRLTQLIETYGESGEPSDRIRLLHARGHQLMLQGNYTQAARLLEEAIAGIDQIPLLEGLELHRHRAEVAAIEGHFEAALADLGIIYESQKQLYGGMHSEISATCLAQSVQYMNLGKTRLARERLEEAEAIYRYVFGGDHPILARCLKQRGEIHLFEGELELAQQAFADALKQARTFFGENHPFVAECLMSQANLLIQQGHFKEAEDVTREGLSMNIALLGDDHPKVAENLALLARLRWHAEDLTSAQRLLRQAIERQRERLGPRHPEVAESLNHLGDMYKTSGDYRTAEPMIREALSITQEMFGENHHKSLTSMTYLAGLLRDKGDYEKANEVYRDSLQKRIEVLGEGHPEVAESQANWGRSKMYQGDYKGARELLSQAIVGKIDIYGPDNLAVLIDRYSLACLYRLTGRYLEAEQLLTENLEKIGETEVFTMMCHVALAEVYEAMGKTPEARQHYDVANKIGIMHLKEDNQLRISVALGLTRDLLATNPGQALNRFKEIEQIAASQQNLNPILEIRHMQAKALMALGQTTEAERLLRTVLEGRQEQLGSQHPLCAGTMVDLAEASKETGQQQAALELIRDAAAIFDEKLPKEHEMHQVTRSIEGSLLLQMGRREEARQLLDQAHKALRKQLGAEHPLARQAAARLKKVAN